jgi:hypothetical protein
MVNQIRLILYVGYMYFLQKALKLAVEFTFFLGSSWSLCFFESIMILVTSVFSLFMYYLMIILDTLSILNYKTFFFLDTEFLLLHLIYSRKSRISYNLEWRGHFFNYRNFMRTYWMQHGSLKHVACVERAWGRQILWSGTSADGARPF